ncbi:hypothetical protein [Vogesella indigofera]|uniref:hypothetical protein n=1 Tax=Vogesella indigofera TaxID=45465 RepID=UPI003F42AE9D
MPPLDRLVRKTLAAAIAAMQSPDRHAAMLVAGRTVAVWSRSGAKVDAVHRAILALLFLCFVTVASFNGLASNSSWSRRRRMHKKSGRSSKLVHDN